MITVVVTFIAKPDQAPQLKAGIRDLLKDADDIPGLRYAKFGRRILDDHSEQFLLIVEYATSRDLANAMARPPSEAQLALRDLVADYTVDWWEAADVDFDPETADPIYPREPALQRG